jgi:NADH-quinone oxidoreductase subunit C
VRIRVQVPEDDPTVPTLFKLHPGTEAMEREAYDMFGIVFTDHPDLTRILMPDEWVRPPPPQGLRRGPHPRAVQGCPDGALR